MPKRSAGLILFKRSGADVLVLLVHPGGPFWKNKDAGAWSLPKGEYGEGEDPLAAARREFSEELGAAPPARGYRPLGEARQAGGKVVSAFAVEGDFEPAHLESNTFEIEWPPKSGKRASFPEIDRAAWFPLPAALGKILPGQRVFLDRLHHLLASR